MSLEDIMAPIKVIFKQRVANLIKQGAKGRVLFCKQNASLTDAFKITTFNSAVFDNKQTTNVVPGAVKTGEVKAGGAAEYVISDDAATQVKQIFNGLAKQVILLEYKETIASVKDTIKNDIKWDWIFSTDAAAQEDIAALGKELQKFALVYNLKSDSMFVVSANNPGAVLAGDTKINNSSSIDGLNLLPILAGVIAGCPYDKSISYKVFTELASVIMPADNDIVPGFLTLYNEEEGVRVASPVNSLTTLGENQTEDMKSICIIEGMQRLETDIKYAFRTGYKGKYKNKYDNQSLFFAAVQYYLDELEEAGILDPEYNNTVDVNVDAQRALWKAQGKDADNWDDLTVRKTTYKNMVIAKINAKFLDAMEGMELTVEMF